MPLNCLVACAPAWAARLAPGVVFDAYGELVVQPAPGRPAGTPSLIIGRDVFLGSWFNVRAVGGTIEIGDYVLLAQHVSLIAANHRLDSTDPVRRAGLEEGKTGVRIGRRAWLGCNVIVLPGVEIGEDAVIGAGAVVTRDVPAGEVWAGNPARFVKFCRPAVRAAVADRACAAPLP